ncbi:TolC family protein, partial [Halomonas elongata]|uniref:TolC family protein n=1 Tax=Halomonas elongata TaxID=2746 RepID=UPI00255ACB46
QARLKPQLNLEGSVLRREIGGRMEEDTVLALRVRMEPFQGLSNFRRTDAARQRVEASEWSQRATHRDLRRQITGLVEQDDVLAWRLEALDEQIDNAVDVIETYRDQFDVGFRDVADLLSIERDRFEAKRQRVDLGIERLRIQYRVAAQLGQLGSVLGAPVTDTLADKGAP